MKRIILIIAVVLFTYQSAHAVYTGSALGTELDQCSTIDSTTISAAQWAGVGAATTYGIALMALADAAALQAVSNSFLEDGTIPLTANWDVGAYKITAQDLTADTGDVTVGDDILLADGAVVGITGNEIITFNAAGSINVTGATVDVDGAFTATSVITDGALQAQGAFTSIGIDDNADATAITIAVTTEEVTFSAGATVTGVLTPTGGVKALTPVTDSTADFAANFTGANLYGGTFIANADDGDLVLPAMLVGMNFTIVTLGAIEVVADTNVADGYLMDGTTGVEGANLTNLSTAGDIAVFQYYTADDWLITTNGWTAE